MAQSSMSFDTKIIINHSINKPATLKYIILICLARDFFICKGKKMPEGIAGALSVAQGLRWQHKRVVKLNKRLK